MPQLIHEIDVKQFIADFQAGVEDLELMRKYQITRLQLKAVIKRLERARLLKRCKERVVRINAHELADDIRAGASDESLADKYGLSEKNLEGLLRQLLEMEVLVPADLAHRSGLVEQSSYELAAAESALQLEAVEPSEEETVSETPAPESPEQVVTITVLPVSVLSKLREDSYEVEKLLNEGMDPNARDSQFNRPALIWASGYGNIEVVKILLARGADVSLMDREGQTALSVASSKGYEEIIAVIQEFGAKAEPAHDTESSNP